MTVNASRSALYALTIYHSEYGILQRFSYILPSTYNVLSWPELAEGLSVSLSEVSRCPRGFRISCNLFLPPGVLYNNNTKHMKEIFYNRQEHRIRSGWRALIFLFVYIAFISITVLLRLVAGKTIVTTSVAILALFAATAAALWFASRFVDHRNYREYGFSFDKSWWLDLICGFFISALVFIVVFAIEHTLGWVTITRFLKNEKDVFVNFPFIPTLLFGLLAHTGIVLLEEVYFRGYLIKNLAEGFNNRKLNSGTAIVLAYIASSILFALFHMRNPNISILGVLNICVLGLFFGLPYLLTGEIALSISLHTSWNFFMGVVFGFPISGSMEEIAVIATEQSGPVLWTGGDFGPEGGLIGLFGMLAGCILTVLWIRLSRRRLFLLTRLAAYSHSNESNQES